MNRVYQALKADLSFQMKQGFYAIYLVISVMYIVVLYCFPMDLRKIIAPLCAYSDPAIVGMLFTGAQLMLEKNQGTAGVNASFFDESTLKPAGLIIRQSLKVQNLVTDGRLLTGVLFKRAGKWNITHRKNFNETGVETALQAGPRLIDGGSKVNITSKPVRASRTGVAITRKGEILLYVTTSYFPGISFQDVANVLQIFPVIVLALQALTRALAVSEMIFEADLVLASCDL